MKGSEIMPSLISDLVALVDIEIPEGQQSLKDSYTNLENVANYCESNYFISTCKKSSLEETKNFATQSLASLAYQVNSLAFNVLHVLDLQTSQLSDMESQINHIFQVVQVHKEKVARREIGILTSTKSSTRAHKILAPANQERPVKYIRKPVDYSILDDIGHGVKSYTSNNTPKRSKRTLAPLHQNPLNGTSAGPAPTTKPPTPPQPIRTGGSLSRSAKEYRTPAPPIPPPQVPSNYAPNYPLMSYPKGLKDLRRSGYSTLPIVTSSPQAPQGMTTATQPPIGMVHPMRESLHSNTLGASSPTPPPSPDLNMGNKLQEPPNSAHFECSGNISPPLPPPPEDDSMYHENYNPPSPPSFLRRVEPEWVPKNYIEKVVALYDYSADKEDELSFSESSVIYVVKKNDDGWYEGVLDGITGLFPGNYVEPCL